MNRAEIMDRGRIAVVVGGGLAGIAAATRLADHGWGVTLLESRPRLGGAVYSFDRNGLRVDTGQHVFLRCYRSYRGLLDRLGTAHLAPVQERLDIPVLLPGGRSARLRRTRGLGAPLHLLATLARYGPVAPRQRVDAMRAAVALAKVDPDDPGRDQETFGHWLQRHGQDAQTTDALWRLVTVAALNLEPAEASLALAARVFRTGLLEHASAGDIGMSIAPLSEVHGDAARPMFDRLGVRVRTRERVRAVARGRVEQLVVRTDSGEIEADAVVLAVPPPAAADLAPEEAAPDRKQWAALGASPIVNVHVRYDRRVLRSPFAAALDADLQWVFDRTAAAGADEGQYLVSSLSAADQQIALPAAQVRDSQLTALARVLPDAAAARVLDAFVTREPHATFRQRAGSARMRPSTQTRWEGLTLAGAWTATGWPDTMEGAVRGGLSAADALRVHSAAAPGRTELIA